MQPAPGVRGAGRLPVVVLLHGGGLNAHTWDGVVLALRRPTVAIDLPLKVLVWEDADGHAWVAYNEAEYLQTRHHFPPELTKNIAALGALAATAAGDDP